jgi:hypothetical protein
VNDGSVSVYDFVAVKLHPHAQRTVRGTDRLYVNHVTRTDPVGSRLVTCLRWHLEEELNWRASDKWQIRYKVSACRRKIKRLGSPEWRGGVQERNAEPDS